MKPVNHSKKNREFPLAKVSRVPLKTGLEYSMAVTTRPIRAPDIPQPIQSSLAQNTDTHRFQFSRNTHLLRNYGMRPDYPTLQASRTPLKSRANAHVPKPVLTTGASSIGRVNARAVPPFPFVARPGAMGSVKRFPKAVIVRPNRYVPPVYGGGKQEDGE